VAAEEEVLKTLREEAKRRGISLALLVSETQDR
jgi:hypothetical protein